MEGKRMKNDNLKEMVPINTEGVVATYTDGNEEYHVTFQSHTEHLFSSGENSCTIEQLKKAAEDKPLVIEKQGKGYFSSFYVQCADDEFQYSPSMSAPLKDNEPEYMGAIHGLGELTSWEEMENRYAYIDHSGADPSWKNITSNTVGYSNANVSAKVETPEQIQAEIDGQAGSVWAPNLSDVPTVVGSIADNVLDYVPKQTISIVKRVPIAATVVDAGIRTKDVVQAGMKEGFNSGGFWGKVAEELTGFGASFGGGSGGGFAGAKFGATIGAFGGPVGAAIGGTIFGIGGAIIGSYVLDRINKEVHNIGRDLKKDDGVGIRAEQIKESLNAPIIYDEPIGPNLPTLEDILDRHALDELIDDLMNELYPPTLQDVLNQNNLD